MLLGGACTGQRINIDIAPNVGLTLQDGVPAVVVRACFSDYLGTLAAEHRSNPRPKGGQEKYWELVPYGPTPATEQKGIAVLKLGGPPVSGMQFVEDRPVLSEADMRLYYTTGFVDNDSIRFKPNQLREGETIYEMRGSTHAIKTSDLERRWRNVACGPQGPPGLLDDH